MALPDDDMRHELIAGVIVDEPLPFPRHDRVRRRIERILEDFAEEHDLGEVFGDAGYLLSADPDTVRGPDVSFIAKERLAHFDYARYFRGAPDLAVEFVTPSNRPNVLRTRIAEYFAAGCRLVWVVDPAKQSVTAYRAPDTPHHVSSKQTLDGGDVLAGLAIPVASIFRR